MADPLKYVVVNALEQQSGTYRAKLQSEYGVGVPAASLTFFLLTLYDLSSSTVINSRNGQNVLNAHQVTIDTTGQIEWLWLPADQQILNPNKPIEEHVALFEAKWTDTNGYPRQANHEVHFMVNRIPKLA